LPGHPFVPIAPRQNILGSMRLYFTVLSLRGEGGLGVGLGQSRIHIADNCRPSTVLNIRIPLSTTNDKDLGKIYSYIYYNPITR
jgi:hypothetical protein